MRVGRHKTTNTMPWKIGDMQIEETKTYKYRGDVISNDGKNGKNIESRRNKMNGTTISIKTIAASGTKEWKVSLNFLQDFRFHDHYQL